MGDLNDLITYLAVEADFNRSWTDGRRGADRNFSDAYKARRIELAVERETWCAKLAALERVVAAARKYVEPVRDRDIIAALDALDGKER